MKEENYCNSSKRKHTHSHKKMIITRWISNQFIIMQIGTIQIHAISYVIGKRFVIRTTRWILFRVIRCAEHSLCSQKEHKKNKWKSLNVGKQTNNGWMNQLFKRVFCVRLFLLSSIAVLTIVSYVCCRFHFFISSNELVSFISGDACNCLYNCDEMQMMKFNWSRST